MYYYVEIYNNRRKGGDSQWGKDANFHDFGH